jgi:hypothetical protein
MIYIRYTYDVLTCNGERSRGAHPIFYVTLRRPACWFETSLTVFAPPHHDRQAVSKGRHARTLRKR